MKLQQACEMGWETDLSRLASALGILTNPATADLDMGGYDVTDIRILSLTGAGSVDLGLSGISNAVQIDFGGGSGASIRDDGASLSISGDLVIGTISNGTSISVDGNVVSVEGQGIFSGTTISDSAITFANVSAGLSLGSNILSLSGINPVDGGLGVMLEGYSNGRIGAFGATPHARVSVAALTNSITAGGVTDTLTNWTDLTTYSNSAAAIRNAIYQLGLKVAAITAGLRPTTGYGLFA